MDKKQKIKVFHALLANLGMMGFKEDMLSGYGVESTLELEDFELDELIARLRKTQQERLQINESEESIRHLRSIVLTILQRMGVYKTNDDWSHVNRYLLEPRICGQLLFELREQELRALIKKLRGIERKESRKKNDIERLKLNN